jgi:hypothetical protein
MMDKVEVKDQTQTILLRFSGRCNMLEVLGLEDK